MSEIERLVRVALRAQFDIAQKATGCDLTWEEFIEQPVPEARECVEIMRAAVMAVLRDEVVAPLIQEGAKQLWFNDGRRYLLLADELREASK